MSRLILFSSFLLVPGKGIGSLVTGKLFDPDTGLGEVWTFRFYSFLALFILILYAAINAIFFRHRQSPLSSNITKGEKQSGIIINSLLTG